MLTHRRSRVALAMLGVLSGLSCRDGAGPESESGVRYVAVAAGYGYTCALDRDSRTYCWGGFNSGDSVPRLLPTPEPLVQIRVPSSGSAGALCGRTADNRVFCWGGYFYGHDQVNRYGDGQSGFEIVDAAGVTDISLGRGHGCGIRADSTVTCWGSFISGKRGRPFTDPNELADLTSLPILSDAPFATLALGDEFSCGILTDGQVACWGDSALVGNPSGPFAHGSDPCWLADTCRLSAKAIIGLTGTVRLAATGFHACALASIGLECWGDNYGGQLGNTLATHSNLPVAVAVPGVVTDISVGGQQSCALTSDGAVWCWGDLAIDRTRVYPPSTPTRFRLPNQKFVAVSAGYLHTCAITAGGSLYCWGALGSALGDGTGKASATPVRVAEPRTFLPD